MLCEQYAAALYELSYNDIDSIKDNFDDLIEILKQNNDFLLLLKSPAIDKKNKKEIIKNTLPMTELFINFLYVLIDNGRFSLINDVYKIFNKLVVDANGVFVVDAFTSVSLTTKETDALVSNLQKQIKGKIKINNIVDSKTIGGMRLEHNGESIDQTFKTKMYNLKALL